jgi:acyl-CoA thioesterase II
MTADSAQSSLEQEILLALDGLLRALELEPIGDDRFRLAGEPARFDRIFGGQALGQALIAAGATVPGDKPPHSLHAYFVDAGIAGEPVELLVERVRDGRSISTRRITVEQDGRTLLTAIASFHAGPAGSQFAVPAPNTPAPDQFPVLQDWVRELPPELEPYGRTWVEKPPPVELRLGEALNFMGGPNEQSERSHWMRLPRQVGDDPLLHSALLAYASDYFLLDMILRAHPERETFKGFAATSLDHAIWFHRPVHFDRWHVHTQQAQAISGHRGLASGAIHDADGRLVASVMQEVLVRPAKERP